MIGAWEGKKSLRPSACPPSRRRYARPHAEPEWPIQTRAQAILTAAQKRTLVRMVRQEFKAELRRLGEGRVRVERYEPMSAQERSSKPYWCPTTVTAIVGLLLVVLNLIPGLRFDALGFGFPLTFLLYLDGGCSYFSWLEFAADLVIFIVALAITYFALKARVKGSAGSEEGQGKNADG